MHCNNVLLLKNNDGMLGVDDTFIFEDELSNLKGFHLR